MDDVIIEKTQKMIDSLKAVCREGGLSNSAGEYKIVTEVFLYKYLNDKFFFEVKKINPELKEKTEEKLSLLSAEEYELLLLELPADTAKLKPEHFLSTLYNRKNEEKFSEVFDSTLLSLADFNIDIFSVSTESAGKIRLFGAISPLVTDVGKRDFFCRALCDKLVEFSFEEVFSQKYDFFSTIFEYLISDYNKDSGKYGEYYTPNSIARIIARILVRSPVSNVTLYDPAAGSGTLLLALADKVGTEKCSIFSQDISQKSCEFLRLNLILNNLVHSLDHVINGNTLTSPAHKNLRGDRLERFDFIVSNPPFNTDFSDTQPELCGESHAKRFFAGVPKIPNKKKDSMSIYLLFIQHILFSLKENGKAAVVVPTGFLTAKSGIELRIREFIIQNRMLSGVVSMPSNIFANTGTNVSILFLDKDVHDSVILIDASKLGEKKKVDGLQRTFLSSDEQEKIVETFLSGSAVEDFSVCVSFEDISAKKYSFSAGQYFEVKIEYLDITPDEFAQKMAVSEEKIEYLFAEGKKLEEEISSQLKNLRFW